MDKTSTEQILRYLDAAGAGLCPVTGQPLKDENLLAARVAFYDLARHIRELSAQPLPVEGKLADKAADTSSQDTGPEASQPNPPTPKEKPPANTGKTWTDEDINVCLTMYHDQFPLGEIGKKIHRTPWSIAIKLNHLGEMGDEALERLRVEFGKNEPSASVKQAKRA